MNRNETAGLFTSVTLEVVWGEGQPRLTAKPESDQAFQSWLLLLFNNPQCDHMERLEAVKSLIKWTASGSVHCISTPGRCLSFSSWTHFSFMLTPILPLKTHCVAIYKERSVWFTAIWGTPAADVPAKKLSYIWINYSECGFFFFHSSTSAVHFSSQHPFIFLSLSPHPSNTFSPTSSWLTAGCCRGSHLSDWGRTSKK